MIEVTDEMVYAFAGEPEITATDAHAISVGLAAVLAIVERTVRERVSDALDTHASELRGAPFRRGDVGIEFICGIEDAAEMVRSDRYQRGGA